MKIFKKFVTRFRIFKFVGCAKNGLCSRKNWIKNMEFQCLCRAAVITQSRRVGKTSFPLIPGAHVNAPHPHKLLALRLQIRLRIIIY